eukprot:3321655-Amphidinium_carterae.2
MREWSSGTACGEVSHARVVVASAHSEKTPLLDRLMDSDVQEAAMLALRQLLQAPWFSCVGGVKNCRQHAMSMESCFISRWLQGVAPVWFAGSCRRCA